jgi:hypothetical protein
MLPVLSFSTKDTAYCNPCDAYQLQLFIASAQSILEFNSFCQLCTRLHKTVNIYLLLSFLQVMHMGTPVTSLTLSGSQDLLATAHVNKRGVFLWSNQLMFGDPASVATYSDAAIPVHLPTIAAVNSGKQQQGGTQHKQQQKDKVTVAATRAGKQQQKGDAADSSSEEDEEQQSEQEEEQGAAEILQGTEVRLLVDGGVFSDVEGDSSSDYYQSDEDSSSSGSEAEADEAAAGSRSSDAGDSSSGEDEQQNQKQRRKKRSRSRRAAEAAATAAAAVAAAAYRQTDSSGAPAPLGPNLATLSLLPRSQVGDTARLINTASCSCGDCRFLPVTAPLLSIALAS